MTKAGGIIALIAGIFAVLASIVTLLFGGLGGALQAEGAETVVGLGWGGMFFSFLVIVSGAVSMSTTSKKPGIFLVIFSILGAILGGTIVAIFMVLSLIGGIINLVGVKKKAV